MLKRSAFPHAMAGWLVIGLLMVATTLVYAPGLTGGFVYDDAAFIVGNEAVHVTSADPRDWAAAAFSFPGGAHQGRWFGMLSFAANHYASGLDPFGFKLTNLLIHLLNGLLVFVMLRSLFEWYHECRGGHERSVAFDGSIAAAAIAGLWLVLPINLTGVLYVAQRLEALSNTFVFLGLWLYLRARLVHWRGLGGTRGLWWSLIAFTSIGVLVKESAILLPVYAACTEFALGRGRNADGSASRSIRVLYAAVLAVPMLVGLVWLGSWVFGAQSYARSFDTVQRLLTEARVLVQYMVWTLAPSLDALSLDHDDIVISRGLFDPPTTLASISFLVALIAAAVWQRKHRPLLTLGISWFFAGHLLTATVIPLMLAFEHRNYFPSLGLLLAGASLFSLEGRIPRMRLRVAIAVTLFCFYSFTTWMRAEEWSDPIRLAVTDASKRPDSPLAQYGKASLLIKAGATLGPAAVEEGLRTLEEKRHLDGASIAYEQALITLNANTGHPVDPDWYDSILRKLRDAAPSLQDARALQMLNECFAKAKCNRGISFLDEAYAAAMSFPRPSSLLLYVHSQYAAFLKNDYAQAEADLRRTIAMSPYDGAAWEALATVLIGGGQASEVETIVVRMRSINHFGELDGAIRNVQRQAAHAK